MSRETEYGLHFAGVSYYDGQGFMTKKARNIDTALALDGSKVCVQENTTTELNLSDYFKSNNMKFEQVKFNKLEDMLKAYDDGKCDTITSDISQLYAQRLKLAKANDSVILPDVISKDPLAPVVRHRDDQWLMIVKWTLFAMINAEELGITSKNIDEAMRSGKPEVQRFMGVSSDYGDDIGLTRDWASRIVRLVGNYGEIYDRNVGDHSKLGIPRGMNQLWDAGGIQYAPPIR
jgi:general L-amino acid transport system substrate-binding protein